MQTKTKRLTESAMLIAVAIVLELVSKMFIPEMPFGGQVTLVSMLPIVLISYRHGMKWGFLASFTYALIEMVIGGKTVAAAFQPGFFGDGTMIGNAIIMCLFDYILAYTLLGLGGCFRSSIKHSGISLMCGTLVALGCRYLAHIVSGYVLFAGWAEWFFTQEGFYSWGQTIMNTYTGNALSLVYSIIYNGFYMIPEIVITTIVAAVIGKIPQITKTKA